MNRQELPRLLQEALAHLHNLAYLESHPLALLLGKDGRRLSGEAVRRLLVETIDRLKPTQSTPATLADWRRHRHLALRYLEGYSLTQISHELVVSPRQASRDHQQAIAALSTLLWVRVSLQPPDRQLAVELRPVTDLPAPRTARRFDGSAKPDPAWIDTDLRKTLQGVLVTLRHLLPDRRVRVALSVPEALSPLVSDQALLRQAMLHLLLYAANVGQGETISMAASDETPGVTLRIEIPVPGHRRATRRQGGHYQPRNVETSVGLKDDLTGGLGDLNDGLKWDLKADLKNDLIESGRDLLERAGGTVAVEEERRGHCCLTIVLPSLEQRQILLVDDNPDIAGLFQRYLRGIPYRLSQAHSGVNALQLVRESRPDLIILDVLMPSQDGWDLLSRMRAISTLAETPVIICSVLPERALADTFRVADFLSKPVTRDALLAILDRWCPLPGPRLTRP